MYRLLIIVSLLPIIIAMIVRWWMGKRVLATVGKRGCQCDLTRWFPPGGDNSLIRRSSDNAANFGHELRLMAIEAWREENPQAAKTRANTHRFGAAVPPLATMVAAFALLVGKLPVMGVFAILFAAIALAAAMSLLGLPAELHAITRHAKRIRSEKSFPDPGEEQAVIDCAIAHAWNAAAPPVIRWLQG
jgi:hypothetical protein